MSTYPSTKIARDLANKTQIEVHRVDDHLWADAIAGGIVVGGHGLDLEDNGFRTVKTSPFAFDANEKDLPLDDLAYELASHMGCPVDAFVVDEDETNFDEVIQADNAAYDTLIDRLEDALLDKASEIRTFA